MCALIPSSPPPPLVQVRAHVYVSNEEDRPMADVAVAARITYPNGTDASRCFFFSDPLLQGIDDVSGAGSTAHQPRTTCSTYASRCFVFSDPLLQGIDDVSGAGES
ncbi:unnamed protein product [Closterium sp. Yama58-4]|nr:unnamed protein product [Closterium sp. Yama58-4]